MMFNFPFYPYHHSRYYPFNTYNRYNKTYYNNNVDDYKSQTYITRNNKNVKNDKTDKTLQNNQNTKNSKKFNETIEFSKDSNYEKRNYQDNSAIIEIFGLKLYYDDILLICLIFFLYNEGIKDDSLFTILVLLLLS